MADLSQLAKAIENTEGKTPIEVLDAFIPRGQKVAGLPLKEINFGHTLFLSSIDHPLGDGRIEGWTAQDIGMALFTFTRPSRELAAMVREDTLEDSFFEFLDSIPFSEIENAASILIGHYFGALKTIVPMESKDSPSAQKKTLSVGS
jgi:hypothetical protein